MEYKFICPKCGLQIEFLYGESDETKREVLCNPDGTPKDFKDFECRCGYVVDIDNKTRVFKE